MANPTATTTSRATTNPSDKRRKLSDQHNHHSLLPGLPDHISHLCLSLISPSDLYSVRRSWRRLIYSASFPPFRSLYTLSLPTTAAAAADSSQVLRLSSFDPISSKWITIDSPPLPPFLHRHPWFISRHLPIQSLSVSGNLVILAATSVHRNLPIPALPHPLIFNPLTNTWSSGPPLPTPRRWCAAGALQQTVVVASGVGSHYTETVARSVEKWVFRKTQSFDNKRRDSNGNLEKIQSLTTSELKTKSFDDRRRVSNENLEKIRTLSISELKTESSDNKRRVSNGNLKKIQSLTISELKTGSFDNKRRVSNGNLEKIRSLTTSELKNESLDNRIRVSNGNLKKIQSLTISELETESFDNRRQDSYGNFEKIRSLTISELITESFDGNWEKIRSLKNSKLCREAIDAVGWKGKLCMVNVKGDYTKEGFVYDLDSDEWVEMPEGMLGGWRGPAAAMEEETMYVVDESRGVLRRYNEGVDKWSDVLEDERLKGAEYIAAGGGRVCVVCEKNLGIVVVDVVATPPRLWVVETSPGYEILALHILPRMCLPEFRSPVMC